MSRCRFFVLVLTALSVPSADAADFEFFGRAGDAIAIDFGSLPGVAGGASFSGLSTAGFSGHTVLTSSNLSQGDFANDGRLWVFANPGLNTAELGDADPASRGFQGRLEGTVVVDGESKSFAVTVKPGYTGSGSGAVQQSFERVNRAANNRLFVAQQQHRLRYLGFVRQGGLPLAVTGTFDTGTDQAVQTFQASFDVNVNATQTNSSEADGIVGPTSAAWLNAANAPTWDELIDPDPQVPGTFSVAGMIGDFDILPGSDPGGGGRTGLTPQSERFGTSWAIDLFKKGSALAKQNTGQTQLMNGISTVDGYGSGAFHSSHRVGMDVDIHVDGSTHNFGNGSISAAEQQVIDTALAFISAPDTSDVARILTSNQDILNGINAQAPGIAAYDASGGHRNHLHIDVAVPAREAGLANLPGDFNYDNLVDAADYTVWRDGLGSTLVAADYSVWQANFGATRPLATSTAIPEPSSVVLAAMACIAARGR